MAKWNGTNWSSIGSGMNGTVRALAVDGNGNVYAGGSFTGAGGVTVNYVAKWNGSAWSAMGHGFNGAVSALAVDGSNNVYAGGDFLWACDATCNPAISTAVYNVAKWNGSAWSPMGNGFDNMVLALAADHSNNVYAGGSFTILCAAGPGCPVGAAVYRIAKWTGANWLPLENGLNDAVDALAVDRANNVYAGGIFTRTMTGLPLMFVGRWDGTTWWSVGNGFNSSVIALTVDSSDNLYAGGNFTLACDGTCSSAASTTVNRVAMWTGSAWYQLGSGTNGNVTTLVTRIKTLFVGGSFSLAPRFIQAWLCGSVVI